MKRTIKKSAAGVLAAVMVISGAAGVFAAGPGCRGNAGCGGRRGNYAGSSWNNAAGEDGDRKCDYAGCTWLDENGDGICDYAGCTWLDEDEDGICDHCGKKQEDCASQRGHGVNFEDEDEDGICDFRPATAGYGEGRGCRGRRRR